MSKQTGIDVLVIEGSGQLFAVPMSGTLQPVSTEQLLPVGFGDSCEGTRPYRLNGHSTTKQAMPGNQSRKHRYYEHYYPLPNGDIYIITPQGKIKAVLKGRDDSICVWSPHGGLYPHYWKPGTTLFLPHAADEGDCGYVCIDDNNGFCSPMTDDTFCIMTSPISGLIIREGVVLYEGKMDGRWIPAARPYNPGTEQLIVERQWAKDEDGKYLAKGTDPYNHWVWHKKVQTTLCKGTDPCWYEQCGDWAAAKGGAATLVQECRQTVICCQASDRDSSCRASYSPTNRYDNTDEVTWKQYDSTNAWGYDSCIPEERRSMYSPSVSTIDKATGGLIFTNAIQDGYHGFASFQIESVVKRFKWRSWLGEIADVSELPGFVEQTATHIKTDWDAVRAYRIVLPQGNTNAGALIRQGLQTGDCFYNEAADKYWRMEFNGWKEYTGYADRVDDDNTGKYGIILPSMTEEHSAQDGCKAKIIAPGMIQGNCAKGAGFVLIPPTYLSHGLLVDAEGNQTKIGRGAARSICCGDFGISTYSIGGVQHTRVITAAGVWEGGGNFDLTCRGSGPYLLLCALGEDSFEAFHISTGHLGSFRTGVAHMVASRETTLRQTAGLAVFWRDGEICLYDQGVLKGCYPANVVTGSGSGAVVWFPETFQVIREGEFHGGFGSEDLTTLCKMDGVMVALGLSVSTYFSYGANGVPNWEDILSLSPTPEPSIPGKYLHAWRGYTTLTADVGGGWLNDTTAAGQVAPNEKYRRIQAVEIWDYEINEDRYGSPFLEQDHTVYIIGTEHVAPVDAIGTIIGQLTRPVVRWTEWIPNRHVEHRVMSDLLSRHYNWLVAEELNLGISLCIFASNYICPNGRLPHFTLRVDGTISDELPDDWLLQLLDSTEPFNILQQAGVKKELLEERGIPYVECDGDDDGSPYSDDEPSCFVEVTGRWTWSFGSVGGYTYPNAKCFAGYFSKVKETVDCETLYVGAYFGRYVPRYDLESLPYRYHDPAVFFYQEPPFFSDNFGEIPTPPPPLDLCTTIIKCAQNSAFVLDAEGIWKHTWSGVYKTTKGSEIESVVTEIPSAPGYMSRSVRCCPEMPFAIFQQTGPWTYNGDGTVTCDDVRIHVIYKGAITTYASSMRGGLDSFGNVVFAQITGGCSCGIASYLIEYTDDDTGERHSIRKLFLDLPGADTDEITISCCANSFVLATQGNPAFFFDYERKLKPDPNNPNNMVDDGSWLRLDDDTLCEANEIYRHSYMVNDNDGTGMTSVYVWDVLTWKFTDKNGDTRIFWNPFQAVMNGSTTIDLDQMQTFVPAKQVRKDAGRGHGGTAVPPKQWLLHRETPTDDWSLIAQDNNGNL